MISVAKLKIACRVNLLNVGATLYPASSNPFQTPFFRCLPVTARFAGIFNIHLFASLTSSIQSSTASIHSFIHPP